MKPKILDILGIFAFLYVICCALYMLFIDVLPEWAVALLLIVALVGFMVDSSIVFRYFIRKK